MDVTWALLAVLSLVLHAESRCSPTAYYKNCWIRRFPGIYIDIEESQRRGAQLLKHYQEDTALKCSRTCCLTRNFSCNLAIFHYEPTQDNVNCFHLHCPTLESCILSHRGNVVLYNITKGVDPDLLVFGKYFTSNVRLLPHHYTRGNASEPLSSDKRQFVHPPLPAALPLTSAPTVKPTTAAPREPSTTSTTQPSTSQPAAVTTAPVSSTSLTSVPSTTPTTSTTSLAPSFPTPYSSNETTNLSPKTTAAPLTTTQPSSPTDPHSTTVPQLTTSPLTSSAESSNVTKGSLGRNHTAGGEEGQGGEETLGGLGAGWHVAAHSVLVAVAVCITVLLSCCCSILLVVSWRGQRKRMGRYRTSWRGKRGSMRLIKYMLVRENA